MTSMPAAAAPATSELVDQVDALVSRLTAQNADLELQLAKVSLAGRYCIVILDARRI